MDCGDCGVPSHRTPNSEGQVYSFETVEQPGNVVLADCHRICVTSLVIC